MINSLHVKNYKCYKEEKFRFSNMTIFAGANSAGKSTVLQALLLYEGARKEADDEQIYINKYLKVNTGNPRKLIAYDAIDDLDCDFEISVNNNPLKFYLSMINTLSIKKKSCNNPYELDISYLNAERVGPRLSYNTEDINKIAVDGSNAAYMIELADNEGLMVPIELCPRTDNKKFSYQVENWMSLIMGKVELRTRFDSDKSTTELMYKNSYTDEFVVPTMTGFGLSYELSIIVAGLWVASKKESVLVIENPEAHLHPSAQSVIGKFLMMVASTGVQVVLETHSEHIIDGIRIQAHMLGCTDSVLINYLAQGEKHPQLVEILVKKSGELSEWPKGFFDQKNEDLRMLFELRRDDR